MIGRIQPRKIMSSTKNRIIYDLSQKGTFDRTLFSSTDRSLPLSDYLLESLIITRKIEGQPINKDVFISLNKIQAIRSYFYSEYQLWGRIELDAVTKEFSIQNNDAVSIVRREFLSSLYMGILDSEQKTFYSSDRLKAEISLILNRERKKAAIFDQLRDAMRIGVSGAKKGLNDDGGNVDIKAIQKAVTAFRNSTEVKTAAEKDNDYKKMVEQIDKYWEKLFADPIMVTTANGEQILILPQRTNNILERFFRDLKRMYRSKSGTQSLNKVIKAMLAGTPLVKNLSNPEYVKIILNGHSTLEDRFAKIDEELVRKQMAARNDRQGIPAKMKRVMRKPNFPLLIGKTCKTATAA